MPTRTTPPPRYPEIRVEETRTPLGLIALTRRALRDAEVPEPEIDHFVNDATIAFVRDGLAGLRREVATWVVLDLRPERRK